MSRLCRHICRSVVLALGLSLNLVCAMASEVGLYRANVVVSGKSETNRAIGLAQCLEDVLVKVSGDQSLIQDPKVAVLKKNAAEFVANFQYRDRMSGVPIHDEQGTYDRPHDLTAEFAPTRIDAILHSLGREAWLAPRPRIGIFLAVDGRKDNFVLASDSPRDPDMRSALATAADRVGLAIVLPSTAELAGSAMTTETLSRASLSELDGAARNLGDDVALAGALHWSDEALGWIADWRLSFRGEPYQWKVRGVGFDEAFRNGMRGAAQVLSGHGQPQ